MTPTDLELLRQYTRNQSQPAFAAIVRRHLDLVYSAALRQVRSPQLAEEVAQSVFADLAASADRLKPDTVLSAWLYKVTHRTAINTVRSEARRQLREQIAFEMNTINASEADWAGIEPLLDEAMHALDEIERAAVLLRYFENKSLREVGMTLGMSDDAAQKRVSRALERLREFFLKRGKTVGASALAATVSAHAIGAAPASLALTISTAVAPAATGVATLGSAAVKVVALTTLQRTLVSLTVALALGTGIFQARRASTWRTEAQALEMQQAPLTYHLERLEAERNDLSNRLALVVADNRSLKDNQGDLFKLRAEITRLRGEVAEFEKLRQPNAFANRTPAGPASQPTFVIKPEIGCRANLRRIGEAIAVYALENKKIDGADVSVDDVVRYLGPGVTELPQCPLGGSYSFAHVGEHPLCSVEGHSY